MFKHILVSTDGTARSNNAIKAAARLAKACKAELTIFHATPVYRLPPYTESVTYNWPSEIQYNKQTTAAADKLLAKARALASKEGAKAAIAQDRSDSPADAVVKAANKARADAIVMASHGRTGIERIFLGSETQKVLAKTKLAVVVVR